MIYLIVYITSDTGHGNVSRLPHTVAGLLRELRAPCRLELDRLLPSPVDLGGHLEGVRHRAVARCDPPQADQEHRDGSCGRRALRPQGRLRRAREEVRKIWNGDN